MYVCVCVCVCVCCVYVYVYVCVSVCARVRKRVRVCNIYKYYQQLTNMLASDLLIICQYQWVPIVLEKESLKDIKSYLLLMSLE